MHNIVAYLILPLADLSRVRDVPWEKGSPLYTFSCQFVPSHICNLLTPLFYCFMYDEARIMTPISLAAFLYAFSSPIGDNRCIHSNLELVKLDEPVSITQYSRPCMLIMLIGKLLVCVRGHHVMPL